MLLINRTLLKMAKGLWGWILAITLMKLITLAGTTAFARVISEFLGSLTSPSMTLAAAGSAILSALAAALVTLAAELLRGELEFRCTAKARCSLRDQIFSKILELDVGNIEIIGPVSAITSSVDGVESMQTYYSQYLPGLLYCLLAPIYLFFNLRSISLPVAIFLFVISFILLPFNNLYRQKIEKLKTDYWNAMEDLTGCYLEGVQGLTTLKLFGQDGAHSEKLNRKATDFNAKVMRVMKVNFSSFLLSDSLIYGSTLIAVILTGAGLLDGSITLASALMVLMLSYSFFDSVRQLMNSTHIALTGVAAAEKVARILDIDSTRPYNPALSPDEPAFSGVRMEQVSHTYTGRNAALTDISLEVPRGQVTALVGLSGCGKSTVASLLMRFSDPSSGRIKLEGRDYTSMTPEMVRQHIIMVPQTVGLFTGTIAENLRIARENATDEELLNVLEQVQLLDWLQEQPDGLQTNVGDAGGKLSGGQRQKIGIARALLCPAEYIIFDEATSSVDQHSEQEIWNCIANLAQSRTLILISHRLSTIRDADCIYVLDSGRIAEHGRHAQLSSSNGLYARLVEEQTALEEGAVL